MFFWNVSITMFFQNIFIQSSFTVDGFYQDKQLKYIITYFSYLSLKLFVEIVPDVVYRWLNKLKDQYQVAFSY